MDLLWWTQIVLTAGVVLALLDIVSSQVDGRRLPPGPLKLPLIGNLHLLGKLPHQSLQSLAKKYGPLMSMKLGTTPTIVVSSPDLAREVLKVQSHIFANRAPTIQAEIMTYGNQDMLWSDVGPHWRFMRRISRFELLSTSRIFSYRAIRRDEVSHTMKEILEETNANGMVVLEPKLKQLSLNNITRMTFSKRYFGGRETGSREARTYSSTIESILKVSGMFMPGQYIPALRWLDIGGHEAKLWELFGVMDKFLDETVEERRKENKSEARVDRAPDCLDVLLDLKGPDAISDDAIKAFFVDMILAGSDSSATQLGWAMAELMRNPEIMKRAKEELTSVVGPNRPVEEEDIPNLPYLQAIVKENMRLHTVVPLVNRVAGDDTHLAGYQVPKGTRLTLNYYTIARDASTWERPDEFDPDRHATNTKVDFNGEDFSMLPFGGGMRLCPGKSLGMLLMHYTLAQLLHSFDWALPEGQTPEDVDMSETIGLVVPRSTPLKLVPSPRLPLQILLNQTTSLNSSAEQQRLSGTL